MTFFHDYYYFIYNLIKRGITGLSLSASWQVIFNLCKSWIVIESKIFSLNLSQTYIHEFSFSFFSFSFLFTWDGFTLKQGKMFLHHCVDLIIHTAIHLWFESLFKFSLHRASCYKKIMSGWSIWLFPMTCCIVNLIEIRSE